ncbi:MAG: SCO family protein [Ideonella sp.]|jgi:protein SCO1/2|nr:SCO family protein [Ideonella sp.]
MFGFAGRHAGGLAVATAAMAVWLAVAPAQADAQPAPLQGLHLRDHHDLPLRPHEFAGRPVLLHFVFAGCSRVCPLQLQELRAVHEALPAPVRERVVFLSVTVDPLSDTPAALRAYARGQGVDRAGWRFVSGAPAQVHRLHERLQAFDPRVASPTPDDHRTSLFLYGSDGQLLQRHRGVPVDRVRLVDELSRLVRPTPAPAVPSAQSLLH